MARSQSPRINILKHLLQIAITVGLLPLTEVIGSNGNRLHYQAMGESYPAIVSSSSQR